MIKYLYKHPGLVALAGLWFGVMWFFMYHFMVELDRLIGKGVSL